jgi:hypothetical protein
MDGMFPEMLPFAVGLSLLLLIAPCVAWLAVSATNGFRKQGSLPHFAWLCLPAVLVLTNGVIHHCFEIANAFVIKRFCPVSQQHRNINTTQKLYCYWPDSVIWLREILFGIGFAMLSIVLTHLLAPKNHRPYYASVVGLINLVFVYWIYLDSVRDDAPWKVNAFFYSFCGATVLTLALIWRAWIVKRREAYFCGA